MSDNDKNAVSIHVLSDMKHVAKHDVPQEVREQLLSAPTTICTSDNVDACDSRRLSALTRGDGMLYMHVPSGNVARYDVPDVMFDENGIETFKRFLLEKRVPRFSALVSLMSNGGGVMGSEVCADLCNALARYEGDFREWCEENGDDACVKWMETYSRLMDACEDAGTDGMLVLCAEKIF